VHAHAGDEDVAPRLSGESGEDGIDIPWDIGGVVHDDVRDELGERSLQHPRNVQVSDDRLGACGWRLVPATVDREHVVATFEQPFARGTPTAPGGSNERDPQAQGATSNST